MRGMRNVHAVEGSVDDGAAPLPWSSCAFSGMSKEACKGLFLV